MYGTIRKKGLAILLSLAMVISLLPAVTLQASAASVTVTDANISISGATGTDGAYKIGDTVTATWNNTSGGDNNTEIISSVTVDFSQFGGGAAVAATNSSGTWTAIYTITAGTIDAANLNISVTVTNNAALSTTTADTTDATVDNIAPTVTDANISISGATCTGGAYKIGDTVTATWNNTGGGDNNTDMISSVTVNFIQFGGGSAVAATNSSGIWTATYTITAGTIDATNLNISVAVTDNAGNTTVSSDTTNATVDNIAPTVITNVTSLMPNGIYGIGEAITIIVDFCDPVTVTGIPQMLLETGTTDRTISYVSGSGSTSLTFDYMVQAGDTSSDLDYAGTGSLTLNGGTITGGGADASLVLPAPGSAGSLGSNKAIVIDTTAPTASIVVADTFLKAGETSTLTITFSEAVTGLTIADFSIENGILSGISTPDGGLTWTVTLTPMAGTEDTSNLITLDNSGVQDLAGNSGVGTTDSNNYAIDTKRPTATVSMGSTALAAGQTCTVTITFSEAVTGFSNGDISVANGTLTPVSSADGGVTYTATFAAVSINDNTNTIIVNLTGIADAAGNDGIGTASSANYTIIIPPAPDAPTIGTATAGNGQATVSFTPPALSGGALITNYTVTASPGGITATGTASPITVTGLTNGTAYTFTVTATNSAGTGAASATSNSATPVAASTGGGGGSSSSSTTTATSSTVVQVNGESQSAGTTSNTTNSTGQTVTTVTVDTAKLDKVLETKGDKPTITIPVTANSEVAIAGLTGQMIKNMESKEATLAVKTGAATYTLPATEINIDSVSKQLGQDVKLADIKVQIQIAEPPASTVKIVENAAKAGDFTIMVPAVNFEISCTYNGKSVDVSKFNSYVERTVAIPDGVDPTKITTGVVVEPDGTVRHVPTQVIKVNGKYYARMNSLTNSTYTVIWNPITFADIENHWAKDSINDMGSRMVVSGVGNGNYNPNSAITRAEFAAIVVRALGLKTGTDENQFSDVKPADWFFKYVETASEYGIINGKSATTFAPNDKITREQAMTMIARAMKITGFEPTLTDSEIITLLSNYADATSSSSYAKPSIAFCLKTEVISGTSSITLAPKNNITRAEVAVIVERLLKKSELI